VLDLRTCATCTDPIAVAPTDPFEEKPSHYAKRAARTSCVTAPPAFSGVSALVRQSEQALMPVSTSFSSISTTVQREPERTQSALTLHMRKHLPEIAVA
jgi:hypothetical protein